MTKLLMIWRVKFLLLIWGQKNDFMICKSNKSKFHLPLSALSLVAFFCFSTFEVSLIFNHENLAADDEMLRISGNNSSGINDA